jgi:hypothetical protein
LFRFKVDSVFAPSLIATLPVTGVLASVGTMVAVNVVDWPAETLAGVAVSVVVVADWATMFTVSSDDVEGRL